jgi:hypothetical protein
MRLWTRVDVKKVLKYAACATGYHAWFLSSLEMRTRIKLNDVVQQSGELVHCLLLILTISGTVEIIHPFIRYNSARALSRLKKPIGKPTLVYDVSNLMACRLSPGNTLHVFTIILVQHCSYHEPAPLDRHTHSFPL